MLVNLNTVLEEEVRLFAISSDSCYSIQNLSKATDNGTL